MGTRRMLCRQEQAGAGRSKPQVWDLCLGGVSVSHLPHLQAVLSWLSQSGFSSLLFLPPQDPYSGSRLHFAAFLAQTRAHLSCAPSSPIPVPSLLFSIAPLQSALCWLSFTLLYIISCPTTQETTIPHFQNPPPWQILCFFSLHPWEQSFLGF